MAPSSPSSPTTPASPAIPTDSLKDTLDIINQEKKEWEKLSNADKWEKLENIWGDIWVTPLNGDGIDPLDDPSDCALWPGHMACSNGTDILNKSWIGFDFAIEKEGCSVCFVVTPVLGHVKLTPYTVCYKWCEEEEESDDSQNLGFPPNLPFNSPSSMSWPAAPQERIIYRYYPGVFYSRESVPDNGGNWGEVTYQEYPPTQQSPEYPPGVLSWTGRNPDGSYYQSFVYGFSNGIVAFRLPAFWEMLTVTCQTGDITLNPSDYFTQYQTAWIYFKTPEGRLFNPALRSFVSDPCFVGGWSALYAAGGTILQYFPPMIYPPSSAKSRSGAQYYIFSENPITPPEEPPPPPPPSPQKNMNNQSCCDLRPILKEIAQARKDIQDLKKSLGTPNSGFVPKGQKVEQVKFNSLGEGLNKLSKDFAQIQTDFYRVLRPDEFGKGGGILGIGQSDKCFIPKEFILPNVEGEEAIENYQELILNLFKMVDRYVGSPKRVVKIKDADPSKPGDQAASITSETVGDGLQNILQYLVDKTSDDVKSDGLYLQFLTKILYQDGISYKNIQWLYEAVNCIIEGLGIGVGEKKETFPMLFNYKPKLPNTQKFTEEQLDKFYTDFVSRTAQAQMKVPYLKEEARSLVSYLVEINKNSGVAAASLGRNINNKNGLENLVRAAYLSERLGSLIMSRAANQPNNIGDLSDFLQDAEKQYKEQGAKDTLVTPLEVEDNKFYGQLKKPKISKRKSRRNRR